MPSNSLPTGGIKIGSMVNSGIQQGSHGAVQNIETSIVQKENAAQLVRAISDLVAQLSLESGAKEELESEIDTLTAVLSSEQPKPSVLKRCFGRIKEAIANAAVSATSVTANAASTNVIARIESYLSQWSSQ